MRKKLPKKPKRAKYVPNRYKLLLDQIELLALRIIEFHAECGCARSAELVLRRLKRVQK